MKKITLLMFALAASFAFNVSAQNSTEAEIVLTQNTDELFNNNGVSCPGGDNWWIREYVLSDYDITSDVMVTALEFEVQNISFEEELEVYAFDYIGFPTGFDVTNPPAALASGTITVSPADIGVKLRATFDSPAVAAAGSSIIVAVVQPFVDGNLVYLGATAADTKESYLGSETCGLTEPDLVSNVGTDGFPEAKHFVNLVVDDALSIGENLSEYVSVYPNPATSVLNVKLPSSVEVKSSSLVDVLGRTTGVVYSNGEMNISGLSQGVYFLNLDTNLGKYTQKVVKQ